MGTMPKGAIGRARDAVAAAEILHQMRSKGRTVATPTERAVLSLFPGWGPMTPMYSPTGTWTEIAEQIRGLLPHEDVKTSELGTYMAFYTPATIARLMWQLMQDLGFTGGKILEPGCGAGVFIGTAPDTAHMVGVERDPTAAEITRVMYPHAEIITSPLQDARLDGGFAGAVGNVPFGNVAVHDPTAPAEVRASVHNYFVWRALHETAPGGLVVVLTSRYTMDSSARGARFAFADMADLVGAVRLPNGALEGGGTQALADIMVLRRKTADTVTHDASTAWMESRVFVPTVSVNRYWDENPGMVLGTMREGQTSQHGLGLIVDADKRRPLGDQLTDAFAEIVEQARQRGLMWQPAPDPSKVPIDTTGIVSKEGWYPGSIRKVNGQVVRVQDGRLEPVSQVTPELMELLALRDLVMQLLELESDHNLPDSALDTLRATTMDAYVSYVKRHGALNRSTILEDTAEAEADRLPVRRGRKPRKSGPLGTTDSGAGIVDDALQSMPDLPPEPMTYRLKAPDLGGFRADPDFPVVAAIEMYDDDTGEHEPAPILTQRQNRRRVRPTHTDDPMTALAWSLDQHAGKVDVPFIAGMLSRPVMAVPGLLGEAVFRDPASERWVTREEYLSGNVRVKLTQAQVAAARDGVEYQRNVEALEQVQPRWLDPHEITAQLGMPWIGKEFVEAFIKDLLGVSAKVLRLDETNEWEVTGGRRDSTLATFDWGTADVDAYRLIQLALNNRIPEVSTLVTLPDGREVKRKDANKSLLAAEKKQQIQARFGDWLWEDADRAELLCHKYNHEFNASVARTFDGSHIRIDGMAPWFEPYKHQLSQTARAVSTRATLCGHPVGAGKTATQGMIAIYLRQLGLIRKPMIAVPKHLLEQTSRQMRQLFPAARILAWTEPLSQYRKSDGGREDFERETDAASGMTESQSDRSRRAFAARCATEDWDLVIITFPAFDRLRVSDYTEADYVAVQQGDLRAAIRKSYPKNQPMPLGMVKRAAKLADTLGAKVKNLRHRKVRRDAGVTFEQLGVDYLLIDEAHYYKNLALPCRTDGFSVQPSKRASDLDLKLSYLRKRGSQPYASLFTGTPISNTMLELYVMMHYLMREYLASIGLGSADAWAAAFVQMATSVEVTTNGGGFQLKTRPSLFVNAPELRMLLSLCADIRTAEELGLKRPDVEERVIVVQPTTMQRQYSADLAERAEKVKGQGRTTGKGADNMLLICSHGRWMATDPHLVGLDDPEPGKLDAVADKMVEIWREHPDALQIGFSDVGTPNAKSDNTYGRLKAKLVERGMPAARIRFIHEAKNGRDKAAMFAECRRDGGTLAILGSTDKLGVGTNIQKRCIATHDIDAPYRPADLAQRLGRAQRPGNRHKKVINCRYVTARTFDAYLWQMLTRKAGFIMQILTGQLGRTVEDITADLVLSYAHIQAAATDQPLLLDKAKIEVDIKRLIGLKRGHQLGVERMRKQVEDLPGRISQHRKDLQMWQGIADAFTGDFADDAAEQLAGMAKNPWQREKRVFAGLTVSFDTWYTTQGEASPQLRVHGGTAGASHDVLLRKFHKGEKLRAEVDWTGKRAEAKADESAASLRRAEDDLAQAKASLGKSFAQDAELTSALAQLDRINAELHAEAIKASRDEPVTDQDRREHAAKAVRPPVAIDQEIAEFVLELGDSALMQELLDQPMNVPDVEADDFGALAEMVLGMQLELDEETMRDFLAILDND